MDYHIYIHSDTTNGGLSNKTTPIQNIESENGESSSAFGNFTKPFSNSQTLKNSELISEGASSLSKVATGIATVYAISKVLDHVATTGFEHLEEYAGRPEDSIVYNNFKTIINNITHPIQSVLTYAHRQAQFRKENLAISEKNKLLGESVLNDYGIGV